jgi:CRISPR-associated protein Csy3
MSGLWDNIDKTGKDETTKEDYWQPIKIYEKRNRATKSQYGAKDKEKAEPNLSWGDDASLPHNADTLRVNFSLKIMGCVGNPTACNDPKFEEEIKSKVGEYKDFEELALRYANNIANGRFLWRNRVGAEELIIKVQYKDKITKEVKDYKFDGYQYQLSTFTKPDKNTDLDQLTKVIQQGLSGESFEFLQITAFAKIGFAQHIWPSQEMVLSKGDKSRTLFQLNDCAAMHSEKIGNALRTIDNCCRTLRLSYFSRSGSSTFK